MVRRRNRGNAPSTQAVLVQPVTTAMERLNVAKPRRRNRRRGPANNNNIPAAQGSVAVVVPSTGRGRNRRGGGTNIGNGGQITIVRSELFQSVASDATKETLISTAIQPGANVMKFLGKLTDCYTRLRWNSITFEWRPAVGTSTNGIMTYGVRFMDDRGSTAPKSRAEVSGLYPVCDHPVWQKSSLPVARSLLMSRNWYATPTNSGGAAPPGTAADPVDLAPGSLLVGVSAVSPAAPLVGELWIHYSVTLDGTRAEN